MHAPRRTFLAAATVFAAAPAYAAPREPNDGLYLFTDYDEARDPAADLATARTRANGRRILIEVGGDWCTWCHILDRYLIDNADVRAAFRESFLILKVNWSREDENEDFLGQYPERDGYPHFFVLDANGQFLSSQGTEPLEEGRSYNRARMLAFAQRWRPS